MQWMPPLLPQDIYKPEMPRLRRQLSAVINFAKFREEKLLAYTEMQAAQEALAQEMRAMEEVHAQMVGATAARGGAACCGWWCCFCCCLLLLVVVVVVVGTRVCFA